ncbi:Transcription factor ILR3 [Abeliophyllum distichum]|uniref:Transcription factor ILR3 n=1 Tax=Abeliophyllum distichum TaxID=126358 RepID=A0ABD1QJ17_9LAMI
MAEHQQIMKSRVVKVDSEKTWDLFASQAKKQGCPVIIHFTASWCVPSVAMKPFFERLALKYQDIMFLLVDVDEVKELASKMEIKAMPTFLFMKEGALVDKLVGANPQEIKKSIPSKINVNVAFGADVNIAKGFPLTPEKDFLSGSCLEMVSPENTNWLYDYEVEDIPVPAGNFSAAAAAGISWSIQPLDGSSNVSVKIDGSFGGQDVRKETASKKRPRVESCTPSSSKACREKQRRDKLNDKFMELGAVLEPGRPPKTDKAAILVDAVRMVTQLRGEAHKLKDSNFNLQEKIKELKSEKNDLRDEKQRLKAQKEKLEQQLNTMNVQPGFLPTPHAIPAAFAAPGQAPGNKLVPIISYPGVAMWQFMPPAAVDTSQDHVLRPPVA